MLANLKVLFLTLLAYSIYFMIAIAVSGSLDRFYEKQEDRVSLPDSKLTLAGQATSAADLAEEMLPQIFSADIPHLSIPQKVYYEVIDADQDTIGITYRFQWEQEIYPEWSLQSYWSYLYMGLNTKDYTLVQLRMNRQKQLVDILYEGQKGLVRADGEAISTIPRLEVVNWAHQLKLLATIPAGLQLQQFDLTYMTNQIYKSQKMARRLQGDYQTLEASANLGVILFAGFIVVIYIYGILKDYLT